MISADEARAELCKHNLLDAAQQAPLIEAAAAQTAEKRRAVAETLLPTVLYNLEAEIRRTVSSNLVRSSQLYFRVGDGTQGNLLCSLLIPKLRELDYGVAHLRRMIPGTPGSWDGTPGRSAYEEHMLKINW